jgi:hypothetical protein
MPAAISPSAGSSMRQASGCSVEPWRWASQFEQTAMTTGSVPMIIVGSGPPARWMALARNR